MNTSKPPTYIFDVDGTLAIMCDRDPYDASKAMGDTLNEAVAYALFALREAWCRIIIVTGRHTGHQTVTEEWLAKNAVRYDEIHCRVEGDYRPDHVVKREILHQKILPKYDVMGVFDDRNSVVKMWRDEGLTCFQVAEGDF